MGASLLALAKSIYYSRKHGILKFEGEVKQPTLLLEQCRGRVFVGGNRHCLFYHFQHITHQSSQRTICV